MESLLAKEFHQMETQGQRQMELPWDQASVQMGHQYVHMKQILRPNYSASCLKAFKWKRGIQQLGALNMMATHSMKQVVHIFPNQKEQ